MSDSMKAIRIVEFKDDRDGYRMWAKKFLSMASVRNYKGILLGIDEVPDSTRDLDDTKEEDAVLAENRKANISAYNDLVLACFGDIGFSIVDEAVIDELPDGDACLAWKNLEKKFQPSSSANKVQLRKQFNSSKLSDVLKDPDEWITKLEILRKRLKKMGTIINDEDLMIHILNNLPMEYDNVVEAMERKLDDVNNPLDILTLRDELVLKFARIQKNNGRALERDEDEDESALVGFSKPFKGRCHNCGQFGHKKANCPMLKNNQDNESKRNRGFNGNCYC